MTAMEDLDGSIRCKEAISLWFKNRPDAEALGIGDLHDAQYGRDEMGVSGLSGSESQSDTRRIGIESNADFVEETYPAPGPESVIWNGKQAW